MRISRRTSCRQGTYGHNLFTFTYAEAMPSNYRESVRCNIYARLESVRTNRKHGVLSIEQQQRVIRQQLWHSIFVRTIYQYLSIMLSFSFLNHFHIIIPNVKCIIHRNDLKCKIMKLAITHVHHHRTIILISS